ncbi:MAG: chemotaxis protein CheW [Thermodesulfobacteriota bacterium]
MQDQSSERQRMQQAFLEEAGDLLPELESALLELDENPGDSDQINRIFRALHTVKGSGAMFGFEEVSGFTHELESAFDLVRNGELTVCKELLDLTFQAKDAIQAWLFEQDEQQREILQNIVQELHRLLPAEQGEVLKQPTIRGQPQQREKRVYRIRFRPDPDIFATGTDPLLLLDELRDLGECHVIAHSEDIPELQNLDPERCHVWWDIILSTEAGKEAIRDVFIFVEEESELHLELIDEASQEEGGYSGYKRLGEILSERGDVDQKELQAVLDSQKRLGEILVESGLVSTSQVQSALAEQQAVRQARESRSQETAMSSVRVPASKLDELVDLVGELVIAQAKLSQTVEDSYDQQLRGLAEEIERLSDELRDNTLGIRMLPIGSSFGKFRRVVRDLSNQKGKEIELVTQGAETELDKTVIERINDPLVHLLRNSIDHGIEPPEQREQKGKPRQGEIRFSAEQSGGNVIISIDDDGQGLDPEGIRDKALEKGLISPEAELSHKEIFNLIFQPGFSTSQEISDISGRGVGMDVVKQNISALRGTVDIDSTLGQGCSIRISLPLTLAIIEGLQVRVEEQHFIIPLSSVQECLELNKNAVSRERGWDFVHLRGQLVPYVRLREWFDQGGKPPGIEQVVVTAAQDKLLGLVVDEVIGQQQTVIKTLSRIYQNIEEVSGATILGDGSIALILDAGKLEDLVSKRKNALA